MAVYRVCFTVERKSLRQDRLQKVIAAYLDKSNLSVNAFSIEHVNTRPSRADRLQEAIAQLEDGNAVVEELKDEMSDWYDSMPENLQGSDKGEAIETASETLSEAYDETANAIGNLQGVEFPSMF
jgi:hypothetical protein